MAILFISYFSKDYFAPLFSLSSCFILLMLIFVIVLPFFAAVSTDGFWTTYNIYTEQPAISFNNELILYALDNDVPCFYSSILELNKYATNQLNSTSLKIINYKSNFDGSTSSVNIKVSFPMNPKNIRNVKLLLFFNYILQKNAKLEMKTMAYIDINTVYGASLIYINGDLNLIQKSPIAYGSVPRSLYNSSIFNNNTSPFDFISIYEQFTNRNLSTKFDYDKIIYPYLYTNEVILDITINFPSYENIFVLSNKMIVFQNAWNQYFCILIFASIVVYSLSFYIFQNQIFQTSISENLPKINPFLSK